MTAEEVAHVGIDPNDSSSVISLPVKELTPFMEIYLRYAPEQLVHHIDEQLKLCRQQGHKRNSVVWGTWSWAMNHATKRRVKEGDPESDMLELTFKYWQRTSELLDLYHTKHKLLGKVKVKQKQRQIKAIRKLIIK